ncbi:hypothetical protein [uncultured Thermanaerothrix sp.]|uniref:hypothetical protein n=1 Tax=uncultured Thermanaerothrix sp. TaxID=1195149 RepID=UPI00344FDFE4
MLNFVRRHPFSTAHEIARGLDLTPADIRYHIRALVKEGHLRSLLPPRYHPRRGRPAAVYFPVHTPSPHALLWLCETLMRALPTQSGLSLLDSIKGLVESLPLESFSSSASPPAKRLNEMMHYLKNKGYEARWEARSSGPMIALSNCPFWPLPLRLPHLCLFDRHLLERLSGLTLEQVERANLDEGLTTCLFKLKHPSA